MFRTCAKHWLRTAFVLLCVLGADVVQAGPIVTFQLDNPTATIEIPSGDPVVHLFTGTLTNNTAFELNFDGDAGGNLSFDSLHQVPFGPQMLYDDPVYGANFGAGLQSLDSEIFLKLSGCVDTSGDPFGCLKPGQTISGVLTSVHVGSTTVPGIYPYNVFGEPAGIVITGSYIDNGVSVLFSEKSPGFTVTVVPEPGTASLLVGGLLLMGGIAVARRSHRA